jgi:hypothetical protein
MTTININQAGKFRVRDRLLNALTVSSGAIDAISFIALGKIFTAFMTGNIVFLGLRVAGNCAPDLVSILTAMLAFALGVYLFREMAPPGNDGIGYIADRPGRISRGLVQGWRTPLNRHGLLPPRILGFCNGYAKCRSQNASCGGCVYNRCHCHIHIPRWRRLQLGCNRSREAASFRRVDLIVHRRHCR